MASTGWFWGDLAIYLGSIALALLALWTFHKQVIRPVKWVIRDLTGEPERPGHKAVPSLSAQMAGVQASLAEIQTLTQQLVVNGGSTLADKVQRIDDRTRRMADDVGHLKDRADENKAGIDRVNQRVTDHRRRQDETSSEIRSYMEQVALRSEAYRAILTELGFPTDPPPHGEGT